MATAKETKAKLVRGVVLFDSWVGKHDEIVEYDEKTAREIEAAGYIDTHPNALKAVE
ncbi:hypothetical protein PT7_P055 (plasmid) [Pusillimonas sp. T7-7]|uniref:hypothetical protein n=1 Tax=Pusillimonas sp. (strain T7-7) TaxID=1007105 RepID=UPI0002084BC4|nr:hypothetical protein [Pusillimonas sp. T7-7]AEC22291.1 hypothetical protein PT7_P055 [Pusillimonas sp. T7-7]